MEKKTQALQIQTWYRVRNAKGRIGWVRADQMLTLLQMSERARVRETAPLRSEARLDALPIEAASAGTQVELIRTGSDWTQIALGPNRIAWIETRHLEPLSDTKKWAAVRSQQSLLATARLDARPVRALPRGSRVEIVKIERGWAEVRTASQRGFLPESALFLREKLDPMSATAVSEFTPMLAEPAPDAALTLQLEPWTPVRILERRAERWGQVHLSKRETVWWHIKPTAKKSQPVPSATLTLNTRDIFARKLFDMASSPIHPELKFASAGGVFRTLDGETWTRLERFKDENHPVAISRDGTVFIGPWRSTDHGETFETYIRWDHLVAAVRQGWQQTNTKSIRVLEIQPQNSAGSHLHVRLDVGLPFPVQVSTRDQGQTWESL